MSPLELVASASPEAATAPPAMGGRAVEFALRLSQRVVAVRGFEATVATICRELRDHFALDRVSLGLVNGDGTRLVGVAIAGLPGDYIRGKAVRVQDRDGVELDAALGRAVCRGVTQVCRDRRADPRYGHGEKLKVFAREYACVPLAARGAALGVLVLSVVGDGKTLAEETIAAVEAFADLVALAILQAKSAAGMEEEFFNILTSFVEVLESRDRATAVHVENVMASAAMLGRDLGLPDGELATLRLSALLHDIGKIAVEDRILKKPGPLTAAEHERMQEHLTLGTEILAGSRSLREARRVIRHHHERWDGTGYPDGLARDEIPLLAQIIALADAYDAMTADRPYRRALPPAEARARLLAGAGSQFNAVLTRRFLRLLAAWEDGEGTISTPAGKAPGHWFRLEGTFSLALGRNICREIRPHLAEGEAWVVIDVCGCHALGDPGVWTLARIATRARAFGGVLIVIAEPEVLRWLLGVSEGAPFRLVHTPAEAERLLRHYVSEW